jgi:hypothetical protein
MRGWRGQRQGREMTDDGMFRKEQAAEAKSPPFVLVYGQSLGKL